MPLVSLLTINAGGWWLYLVPPRTNCGFDFAFSRLQLCLLGLLATGGGLQSTSTDWEALRTAEALKLEADHESFSHPTHFHISVPPTINPPFHGFAVKRWHRAQGCSRLLLLDQMRQTQCFHLCMFSGEIVLIDVETCCPVNLWMWLWAIPRQHEIHGSLMDKGPKMAKRCQECWGCQLCACWK